MIEYEHADVGELYVCHHLDYNTLYIPFIYPLCTRYTCIYSRTPYIVYIYLTHLQTPHIHPIYALNNTTTIYTGVYTGTTS